MDIKTLTRYLPRKFRRKIRKEISRRKIRGEIIKTLYSQRDAAIKNMGERENDIGILENKIQESEDLIYVKDSIVQELEKKVASHRRVVERIERERDYFKDAIQPVIKDARKVKQARKEYQAMVFLDNRFMEGVENRPRWLNEAIIRVAKDNRDKYNEAKKKIEELKKEHLSEKVRMIGGYKRIDQRVPLMVYHKGDFIYETKRFDKMIRSNYALNETLMNDEKFLKAMNRGKRISVEHEEGKLYFVPEKLKNRDSVTIAYFVPGGEKKIAKIFKVQGEKAVKAIYKTLKSYDKQGMDLMNDGK